MTNEHGGSEAGDREGSGSGIVLSKIYTRTGDDGTTMLGDMSRTGKTDPRLVAYADCEEANAALGVALSLGGGLPEQVITLLARVQNDLFDVGADLCSPIRAGESEGERLRITEPYIEYLESACDYYSEGLPVLRSFLLPGGTVAAALLHQARTVVRRAERSTWQALQEHGEASINPMTARYLNRLADLLFIVGRAANADEGDMLWDPGLATQPTEQESEGEETEQAGGAAEPE